MLSTFSADTTERDLWDFDDESESPKVPVEPPPEASSRFFGREIPAPRERVPENPQESEEIKASKLPVGGSDSIRINVNKDLAKNRAAAAAAQDPSIVRDEIDEIEEWDQFPEIPPIEETRIVVVPMPVAPAVVPAAVPLPVAVVTPPPEISPAPQPTFEAAAGAQDESKDEFAFVSRGHAAPVSPRPRLGLSVIERIGLVLLLLLLIAGGSAVFLIFLKHLPTEVPRVRANDFPITGEYLTIESATSYWREPITTGDARDTVRRGTMLLPVLEITTRGRAATVRVYFRNQDGVLIGDSVTKMVRPGTLVQLPATAGFDDPGMHAAYRTGEGKPWTIEVFEAPSENSAGTTFRKLFEMNISTDHR